MGGEYAHGFSQEYNHTGNTVFSKQSGRQYGCIYCIRATGKVMEVISARSKSVIFSGTFAGAGIFLVCPDAGAVFGISEFGMYLTKEKLLSLTYVLLVCCSPVVAWWFTSNGLVEMLVFGQLAVLMFVWWMHRIPVEETVAVNGGDCMVWDSIYSGILSSWQISAWICLPFLLIGIILRDEEHVTWKKGSVILSAVVLLMLMTGALGPFS